MTDTIINKKFEELLSSPSFKTDYEVIEALTHEGLTKEDYLEICNRLNRSPNRTELGMFGVMWSEHCCYRNSKPLLESFPTNGPNILVGPGENAGVVDLGNNQRLAFKIESHNHPSALEPFQGAATGVGGILRDIFTMGARPIAILNALRFGPLEDEKNISLLEGVVEGIAHYGNCVGVPTVGGEIVFDRCYSGNPLVNAMALGLMETREIVCSGAQGIGFSVIYVGSTTGRDGMGGASFASAELTKTSLDDRPAVQVGDPFLEKGLIEACLEVFKEGYVVAAQDMGAAGLTCSCSEMASKGGLGIELDLDRVPAREVGMTAYEFLLSESQERMLFVVKPNFEEKLMEKFQRWGLNAAIVGRVLEENIVRVLHNGKIAAELPASALADDTPVNKHDLLDEPPRDIQKHWQWSEDELPSCKDMGITVNQKKELSWNQILLKLLDSPTIASKKWIYSQYDFQVQANTLIQPGVADATVIRLRPQVNDDSMLSVNRGIAASVDCLNRWVYLDPERGSMASVAEAARNLVCVGAKPLAVTDNLNFASPETSVGFWQLSKSCTGISTACKTLETPVTGGNVSLYNETRLTSGEIEPIHPTPVIGMVGIVEDISNICTQTWKQDGDSIWLLGVPLESSFTKDKRITLSATSYLEYIHELITGQPPIIDLELEKLIHNILLQAISLKIINSAHDISDGGIALAFAESSINSGLGARLELPKSPIRLDRLLFAEGGARILISISSSMEEEWTNLLNEKFSNFDINSFVTRVGTVTANKNLVISQSSKDLINLSLLEVETTFYNAIPRRLTKK